MQSICNDVLGYAGGGDIRFIDGGTRSDVYSVDGSYVVRVSGKNDAAERFQTETAALELVRSRTSVPVPRHVATGSSPPYHWICTTFVLGEGFPELWNASSGPSRMQLAKRAARLLAELHSVRLDRYGHLGEAGEVEEADLVEEKLRQARASALRTGRYEAAEFDVYSARIRDELVRSRDPTGPVLCHGDFHPGNMLVSDRDIHLIDLEFCEGARYALDFARHDYQDCLAPGFSEMIEEAYLEVSGRDETAFRRNLIVSRCLWKLVQSSTRTNSSAAIRDKRRLETEIEFL